MFFFSIEQTVIDPFLMNQLLQQKLHTFHLGILYFLHTS